MGWRENDLEKEQKTEAELTVPDFLSEAENVSEL